MTTRLEKIFAGVDTHADTHHAAVIDSNGKQLGDAQFPTTPAGYAALAAFLTAFGMAVRVGVEGTGSYGAGLARHLGAAGFVVAEVLRPSRQVRRTRGKSDPLDAYAAARAALAQEEHATPKAGAGQVEAIRYLLVARRSAVKARTAAIVQIKSLLVTAPDLIRERYRSLGDKALIAALARLRLSTDALLAAVGQGLRSLARRHQLLGEEVSDLDQALAALTAAANPGLVAAKGIGTITAAQLLVTAGDNPERLRSEASFAALAGVSPIPASSGKTTRHRLNRGGDRQANAALHRIALVRMSYEPRTRDYVARKRALGHSNKEIIRCLKRALAREVFTLLTTIVEVPVTDDLRPLRQARKLSLTTVAEHFNVWPATISKLERGTHRDDDLANSYREWLTAA